MIQDAPDPLNLSAAELESMAAVYQAHEIDDEPLIAWLRAIKAKHPKLVYLRDLPDSDIYPAAEAGLGTDGRSLVNAFMVGQLHAYRQMNELAVQRMTVCQACATKGARG